ncbi:hypothetical protein P9857_10570 [Anoxybacillus geothermalis]|nr:hypothetical protein [Anoxybacillus geothermalis]WJQ07609.1 hypothetical protein QT235_02705 [Geobacillus stearothermophilus]
MTARWAGKFFSLFVHAASYPQRIPPSHVFQGSTTLLCENGALHTKVFVLAVTVRSLLCDRPAAALPDKGRSLLLSFIIRQKMKNSFLFSNKKKQKSDFARFSFPIGACFMV